MNACSRWLELNRTKCIALLQELVSVDSQNLAPEGREWNAQQVVAERLRGLGCEVDVFEPLSVAGLVGHPAFWSERPCVGRPNVVGVRKGSGGGRSLLISSHIDTVPVGPDSWRHDPFAGYIDDGKLFGLGSYDMKAGLAASLLVLEALDDLDLCLEGDLLVESIVDEEYGGGAGTLAARLRYNADVAIVPEPTNMAICPAHRGGLMLQITFRGAGGWSFQAQRSAEPTLALARAIEALHAWSTERNQRTEAPPLFRHDPDLKLLVNRLWAGVSDQPWGDRLPAEAGLIVWIEAFPGMRQEDVLGDLESFWRGARERDAVLASADARFKPLRWLDPSEIDPAHPLVGLLAGC